MLVLWGAYPKRISWSCRAARLAERRNHPGPSFGLPVAAFPPFSSDQHRGEIGGDWLRCDWLSAPEDADCPGQRTHEDAIEFQPKLLGASAIEPLGEWEGQQQMQDVAFRIAVLGGDGTG